MSFPLNFQDFLWRSLILVTEAGITEEYQWIIRQVHPHLADKAVLQPAYRIDYSWNTSGMTVSQFNNYPVYSNTGKFPWKYQSSNKDVTKEDYKDEYLKLTHLTKFNYQSLSSLYKYKNVYWAPYTNSWKYNNHKDVKFTDSEEDPESEENPQEQEEETQENPGNESDNQEEVSQLLEIPGGVAKINLYTGADWVIKEITMACMCTSPQSLNSHAKAARLQLHKAFGRCEM
ncbi:hypothetical protein V8E53_013499 [Lactarius tabidus]